jgi:hypothetical protein
MKTAIYSVIASVLISSSFASTAYAQQKFAESQIIKEQEVQSSTARSDEMKIMRTSHMRDMVLHMEEMLASCEALIKRQSTNNPGVSERSGGA